MEGEQPETEEYLEAEVQSPGQRRRGGDKDRRDALQLMMAPTMKEVTAQQCASESQSVAGGSLPFPTMTNQRSGQRVRFPSAFYVEQALSGIGIDALGRQVDGVKAYVFPVPKAVFFFCLQERHREEENYDENEVFHYPQTQTLIWY